MTFRSLFSRLNPRLKWRGIRGLRYNEQGISAVEFALIAPLLITLYLGSIEVSLLMQVDRRVTQTCGSLGDLTARLTTVTDTDMAEMFAAAQIMMQPYDANAASMRISSVVDNGDGNPRVAWSDAHIIPPYSPGSRITLPDGIVPSHGSVIVAEVYYEYESEFGYILSTSRTVSDKFYLRPRRVSEIARVSSAHGGGNPFGPVS